MVAFLEQTVLLLGFIHAIVLSVFLLKQQRTSPANLYLGVFICLFGLILFSVFLDTSSLLFYYPHLIGVHESLVLALGPLFYLYVAKLTEQVAKKPLWLHFLPCIIVVCLSAEFLLQTAEQKKQFFVFNAPLGPINERFEFLVDSAIPAFTLLQLVCYLSVVFKLLQTHTLYVKGQFSYLEKVNLSWLTWFSRVIAALVVLWLIDELIDLNSRLCYDSAISLFCDMPWVTEERYFYPSEMGLILCVYAMTYYGLKQPAVFSQSKPPQTPAGSINTEQTTRYVNSTLSPQLAKQLFEELDKQVKQQRLYLDPQLTLDGLVSSTGWSRHQLSQAINQVSGKNFFDYVNELRIHDAKQLLLNNTQKTVLDVALETGFNSRSAFYNAFKKYTQQTPSEFKKNPPIAV